MLEKEFHISRLIAKHFRGGLMSGEAKELNAWLDSSKMNRDYFNQLNEEEHIPAELKKYEYIKTQTKDDVWQMTLSRLGTTLETTSKKPETKVGNIKLWPSRWATAAVILMTVGVASWFYIHLKQDKHGLEANYANDVPAGKSTATLTLASGKKIILSNAANGQLAKEAGATISKTVNGQLVYTVAKDDSRVTANDVQLSKQSLNTLSTANGEQYEVILPDGTAAYLNAASSITYPTTFVRSKTRGVSITGEVYFEVTKDKKHPFLVQTANQQVEVLGTHFNINSYTDEPGTTTTLLEGSVRVSSLNNRKDGDRPAGRHSSTGRLLNTVVLSPNQQSTLKDQRLKIDLANTDEAVAWKNGYFRFTEEPLESVMRKISRWYNVKIIYAADAPRDITLGGFISRSKNISAILESMTQTENVRFKINGRIITVLKYK